MPYTHRGMRGTCGWKKMPRALTAICVTSGGSDLLGSLFTVTSKNVLAQFRSQSRNVMELLSKVCGTVHSLYDRTAARCFCKDALLPTKHKNKIAGTNDANELCMHARKK